MGLMTNPAKDKGDKGEREVEAIFRSCGFPKARRMLGAGRKDDIGDFDNLPDLTLQATWQKNLNAVWAKLAATSEQRNRRRTRFGALFYRTDRKPWIVVLTPAQFIRLYKYALIGIAHKKEMDSVKLVVRDNRFRGKGEARTHLG